MKEEDKRAHPEGDVPPSWGEEAVRFGENLDELIEIVNRKFRSSPSSVIEADFTISEAVPEGE